MITLIMNNVFLLFFFLMIRRPPRSTLSSSSAASEVYKRLLIAMARPRSSLLRSSISIHTAIWDAGYSGRSQCLVVNNTGSRFQIKQDSRILQMVFLYLDSNVQEGYSGIYQHENTG